MIGARRSAAGQSARVVGVAALVLALALGGRPVAAAPADVEPPATLVVQTYPAPTRLPPLGLADADGQPDTLDRFLGRVVLVNFWATWCVPCREEMPDLERLSRAYRDRGLVIVGVNFKESPHQAQSFMQQQRLTFSTLLDRDGAASAALRLIGLPVTMLLDRDGRLLWRALGAREWDTPPTRAYLDRVLATP